MRLIGLLVVLFVGFYFVTTQMRDTMYSQVQELQDSLPGGSDTGSLPVGPGTFIPGLTEKFEETQARARDLSRKADLKSLVTSLEIYSIESVGAYPSTDGETRPVAEVLCPDLVKSGFVSDCPEDPSGLPRFYGYRSDGETYELSAILEDPECIDAKASFDDKGRCIYREGSITSSIPGLHGAEPYIPEPYIPDFY